MNTTTCERIHCDAAEGRACRGCAGMPFQCNHCRTHHANASTITRRSIVALMSATGCSAAEAEAAHGITAGPVIQ